MSTLLSLVVVCMLSMLLYLQIFSSGVSSFPHHQFVRRQHYYYQEQKQEHQKIRGSSYGMQYKDYEASI
jgi:hypothetical protein